MRLVAGNAQHIGARPQQQDAFGFSDPSDQKFVAHAGFLGIVADGMGGLTHGSEASRSAVLAFLNAYKRKLAGEPIPKALARCLSEANSAVLHVAENVPAEEEVGTTLVAAVLHDSALHWVSVGDSRIYLLRGATLTRLTADHVYARELNRQAAEGRISLAEAQNHPERASLTSYLGQPELAHVDKNVRPLKVQSEDCVMLCSDGFYRALSQEEIVTGFRAAPQGACDTLLQQALAKQRTQQDNLTVIALKRRTRRPIPVGYKIAGAAMVMLCAVLSAGTCYWYGRIPTLPRPVTAPPQPPPSQQEYPSSKAYPPPSVSRNPPDDQKGKTTNAQNSGSKATHPATNAGHGKAATTTGGKNGEKSGTPTLDGAKNTTETPQTGQPKSNQENAPGTQEKGNRPGDSGTTQTGAPEQQNKTNPTQAPGTMSPTPPATPSKDDQQDAAPQPSREDQPAPPTPRQRDDEEKPPSPQASGSFEHVRVR